jgi:L-cysteine desulfidase
MKENDPLYQTYLQILKEELVPAMGCTEPIAIAYCAAKCREVLVSAPTQATVCLSRNIIKNVKSVVVPNTGGLKGIEASVAAGAAVGKANLKLEVLSEITEAQQAEIRRFLDTVPIAVSAAEGGALLDIKITLSDGVNEACVQITGHHTNIVLIERNHKILFETGKQNTAKQQTADRSLLTMEHIFDFATSAQIEDVDALLRQQCNYNMAIAEEGLKCNYGANVGKVLLKRHDNHVKDRACAYAAAASDARMNGCDLPVVINSGSGNQGITVSVPLIVYAKEYNIAWEPLCRALLISNLTSIHIKFQIGSLSAYCGAVSAGCAAACGIAFLLGGGFREISHTLVNGLAISSGIICDGAKSSCAGKIAASVSSGITGYELFLEDQQFRDGDGIISKGVENTIRNVTRVGSIGMKETDQEIIRIMTNC